MGATTGLGVLGDTTALGAFTFVGVFIASANGAGLTTARGVLALNLSTGGGGGGKAWVISTE